ncbi:MAG: 50S ribosomal protein L23 [Candidatus Pacebacteria bacterium]|nr:50S ribosomal protein L23 [Candidatus Paceibacterota bacterium]
MNPYIIKKPVITEKSLLLAQSENKYVFEVDKLANKDQIRVAVEEFFGVEVQDVNTIRRNKTIKKTGKKRMRVVVPQVKKAIVQLKKGHKIEMFDFNPNEGK